MKFIDDVLEYPKGIHKKEISGKIIFRNNTLLERKKELEMELEKIIQQSESETIKLKEELSDDIYYDVQFLKDSDLNSYNFNGTKTVLTLSSLQEVLLNKQNIEYDDNINIIGIVPLLAKTTFDETEIKEQLIKLANVFNTENKKKFLTPPKRINDVIENIRKDKTNNSYDFIVYRDILKEILNKED